MQEYPKMMYRDGKIQGTTAVFGHKGVFCAVAHDATEADAMIQGAGFRDTVAKAEPIKRRTRKAVAAE